MKIDRQKVLDKYDKHCAYCGCEITLQTMQVDHLWPKVGGGTDDFDNLMPSCRQCNHYKRASPIEIFRYLLLDGVISRLKKIYIFKIALKYGMIEIKGWDRKFYFEKEREK